MPTSLRYETDLEDKNTALEEAQAFISSVIDSVSDILIVCDDNGAILQVNPAAMQLCRPMPQRELLGAASLATVRPRTRARVADRRSGQSPRDVTSVEVRFRTANGLSDLYGDQLPRALFDSAGRRAGTVFTGRPIGELRRAYEALHRPMSICSGAVAHSIEQEKMASLGRLVAGVAHELNNPISFVYGNIHTLDRYRQRDRRLSRRDPCRRRARRSATTLRREIADRRDSRRSTAR